MEDATYVECELLTPFKISFNVIVSNALDSNSSKGSTFPNGCFNVGTSDTWDTWE